MLRNNHTKHGLPQGTHNREPSAKGLTQIWLKKTGRASWLHVNPVLMRRHTVFAKQTWVLCDDFHLWESAISIPSHLPTVRCKATMMPFGETSRPVMPYYRCQGTRRADSLKQRSIFSRIESVNLDIDLDMKLYFIPFQKAIWGDYFSSTWLSTAHPLEKGLQRKQQAQVSCWTALCLIFSSKSGS